jgi:glycosyltransferase involved in cell wall biosynthesis
MKISVIVPVYNTEKFINKCITSILSQSYSNLEVILVNDGSTDQSGVICEHFRSLDNRVIVIHKNNGGQSSARNEGLKIASGDIISFVDSDDWLMPEIYEHGIDLMNKYGCDVVDFKVHYAKSERIVIKNTKKIKIKIVEGQDILLDYLQRGQVENTPFSVYRKLYKVKLLKNITFPVGKINEDISTNYRILMNAQKLVHTSFYGYCYRQEGTTTTRQGFRNKDYDLLTASYELISLAELSKNKTIKYLAEVKLARSYFSLLSKIALYGFNDENIDKKKTTTYLSKELRKNFLFLIKSPMPVSRKILMILFCIDFRFLSIPLKIAKKIKYV